MGSLACVVSSTTSPVNGSLKGCDKGLNIVDSSKSKYKGTPLKIKCISFNLTVTSILRKNRANKIFRALFFLSDFRYWKYLRNKPIAKVKCVR